MRSTALLRLLFCALLVAAAGAGQAASRPVGSALDEDLAASLPRVRELMVEGLRRAEPSSPTFAEIMARPNRTLFKGSYDRHSNAAAHWALLSWARRERDEAAIRFVLGPFTAEGLRAERAFIAACGQRSEVRPYDDAWLLLLWREVAKTAADPETAALARGLADDTGKRLLAYVVECGKRASRDAAAESRAASSRRILGDRRPMAPSPSWSSGAYDSPAFALLVLLLAPPEDEDLRGAVVRARDEYLPVARAAHRAQPRGSSDFLWPEALFALSGALEREPGGSLSGYVLPPHDPPPRTITLANCHTIGREIVKLWPVAFGAGAGDPGARKAFNERLRICLSRGETWRGPFLTVSHWVPQFVYFATWLADGRP
jgi:hypothetical protein